MATLPKIVSVQSPPAIHPPGGIVVGAQICCNSFRFFEGIAAMQYRGSGRRVALSSPGDRDDVFGSRLVHLLSARCAGWTGWPTSSRSFNVTILVRM
jgi:hypothetical protein